MIEENVKRLEEISTKLESGVSIDEILKLYEEVCKISKQCLKELEKAKGKIIMIKKEFNQKDEKDGE